MPKPPIPAAGEAMPAADHPNTRRRFFLLAGHAGAVAAASATLANGLRATGAFSRSPQPGADPIFALIEEHRRLDAFANESGISDNERAARCSLEDDTLRRLAATEPRSLEGARRMLEHLADYDPTSDVHGDVMTTVASALAKMEARHG
jgi:hypothetical protein